MTQVEELRELLARAERVEFAARRFAELLNADPVVEDAGPRSADWMRRHMKLEVLSYALSDVNLAGPVRSNPDVRDDPYVTLSEALMIRIEEMRGLSERFPLIDGPHHPERAAAVRGFGEKLISAADAIAFESKQIENSPLLAVPAAPPPVVPAPEQLTLLDRYPDDNDGNLRFLEFTLREVSQQAELKRNQGQLKLANAALESGVRGILWAGAERRAQRLTQLPQPLIERLLNVLRRRLTVDTLARIETLLTPAIEALRDAWEDISAGRTPQINGEEGPNGSSNGTLRTGTPTENGQKTASRATNTRNSAPRTERRRGRRPDPDDVAREAELAADWARARETGTYKADFARDKEMRVAELDQVLDRVAARRRRSDNRPQ